MKPLIGVISIGQMSRALIKAIESMNLNADFIISDALVKDETRLPKELAKSDVLLSSGYLVKALRRITDKPIIKIEPSMFDILLSYSNVSSYDDAPVIILPSETGAPVISQIQNILSVNIIADYYDTFDDINILLEHYKKQGHKCVIGSGLVCERANSIGMKGIFVYPQESLRSFIQLAFDTATSICKKLEINQQMSTIFQYSHQGILFTDEGGRISICNALAEKILLTEKKNLVGEKLTRFFPEETLEPVMERHEPIKHLMCSFGGEQYVASIVPILSKGDLSNIMVNIDNVRYIQNQERHIRHELARQGFVAKYHFEDYDSHSPMFAAMIKIAKKFARSDDSVVILGETGTGKEVLAQSMHNYSHRRNNPFVAVNCSSISENLLESELFGYDEGAFTGAKRGGKQGFFEIAHKGTIFLDEIGELSLPLQSKLLRVIQEHQLIHVGGSKVINFDARIIAATNRNLWELVQKKKFREDLYYRLAVLEVELPPLRRRQEDIFPLFLNFVAKQNSPLAAQLDERKEQVEEILCGHSWPGNVRELENFAKMLMASTDSGENVLSFIALMRQEVSRRHHRDTVLNEIPVPPDRGDGAYRQIFDALVAANGNYTKAAALIGISRVTLWRRLKAYQNLKKV